MQNLLNELTELLSKDDRLVVDGKLLKNKITEIALSMDADLIKLLLKNKIIKKHFFTDIEGILVFDKIKFQSFVSNKEFLPDSYTAFKNKIGLTNEQGDYITNSQEVVLAWPYKDCVLEGGQTKEDQKRDEIFWNETLAPDEIDRLLAPKVFTDWKKYDSKGEHELTGKEKVDFQNENLIIRGNNLLALQSIHKKYAGSVKLIYIDPPFNTGNDTFNYNDSFTRASWLSFMRSRLESAKMLLSRDGNIFIHIDINQSHYLKVLCDSIFKEENFVEEIIWAYGSPSGGRAATPKPVNIHDYILHYCKDYHSRFQKRVYVPYSDKYIKDWFKYKDEDGRIYQKRQRGQDENGDAQWEKQYLDESKGVPLSTVWSDIKQVYADPRAYKEGQSQHSEIIKDFTGGQKPEALIQRIIEMATDENDLVLDFHIGTGTTCAVAHKMKRRYIGIEQMDYINTFTINRLKKIIKKDQTGISKLVKWEGGGSFIYCELMEWNEAYISKIKKAKSSKELIALWEEMQVKSFISYKINPKIINSNISDFKELSIEDQKRFLIEILDKNQLYVNYSEIDDKEYQVTETDKKINRMFYGEV